MEKTTVFLVDDHAVVREGLQALINAQPDMHVVGQASDSREALALIPGCKPDIVVVDIGLPGLNGMHISERLRELCPNSALVVLTRHRESAYVRQMMQVGVKGYVLKQSGVATLLDAIRAVTAGENYLDPMLAGQMVQKMVAASTQSNVQQQDLSERETAVVQLIALGYSNKEVAAKLDISVKTVDTYKTRALEKLGLDGRAALVRYALERGWLGSSS